MPSLSLDAYHEIVVLLRQHFSDPDQDVHGLVVELILFVEVYAFLLEAIVLLFGLGEQGLALGQRVLLMADGALGLFGLRLDLCWQGCLDSLLSHVFFLQSLDLFLESLDLIDVVLPLLLEVLVLLLEVLAFAVAHHETAAELFQIPSALGARAPPEAFVGATLGRAHLVLA